MGEKSVPPQEHGFEEMDGEEMVNEEDGDMSIEEFQALDSQLDALNSALDGIEQKNDDIYAQLKQLLESNREIRKQLKNEQGVEVNVEQEQTANK